VTNHSHPLTTTTALLDSLKDPDQGAIWTEFDARYRPVLCAIARRVGLTSTDAEEVAQATLVEFVGAYREGRYERAKGRLSSWLIGIAHNRIAMCWRAKGRGAGRDGESVLADLRNRTQASQVWTVERERVIFARAWQMLHATGNTADKTLRAFELVAMRGLSPAVTAAECGMTIDDVYVAKARVTKRLRELAEELTAAYEDES
jgi:RNA polymerase sigma-70 factor (ECF subfamily)